MSERNPDSGQRVKGWAHTEWGDVVHAVLGGRALCGLRDRQWHTAYIGAPPCKHCEARYGPAFPAPPGHEHHSAHLPWFGDYADARNEVVAVGAARRARG